MPDAFVEPDAFLVVEPGLRVVADPGVVVDLGVDAGSEPGAEPGVDAGSEPGAGPGPEAEAVVDAGLELGPDLSPDAHATAWADDVLVEDPVGDAAAAPGSATNVRVRTGAPLGPPVDVEGVGDRPSGGVVRP